MHHPIAPASVARFNTQPPEGGCIAIIRPSQQNTGFNTQPPEGGCCKSCHDSIKARVSTHSRPKAAAPNRAAYFSHCLFQHTAARRRLHIFPGQSAQKAAVSTHSRPKAAALLLSPKATLAMPFQHTAARRRLRKPLLITGWMWRFNTQPPEGGCINRAVRHRTAAVSTHSRPKAAAD